MIVGLALLSAWLGEGERRAQAARAISIGVTPARHLRQ